MNRSAADKIRFWSEIALAAVTLAVALAFIIEAADIYYSADGIIYSREIVWGRLKKLIAPFVIWVVGAIACYVLSVLYPSTEKKRRISPSQRVAAMKRRIPYGEGEEFFAAKKEFKRYEIGRLVMYGLAVAFAVATAIIAIAYLADHSHFEGAINAAVLNLVKNVFTWIVASFIFFIAIVIYDACTAKIESELLKKMLVAGKGKPIYVNPLSAKLTAAREAVAKRSDLIVWIARGAVFVLAVVFIAVGAVNGGARDVLFKAINICTECIGLG